MTSFLAQYNETKELFNKYLDKYLSRLDCAESLNESMKYSLNAGGKRLRPVLMIETGKLFDFASRKSASISPIH